MDLRDLYQDIILDHARSPRNFRGLPDPSHFAHGHNPLCGDKITVFMKIENDSIETVSFEGRGCAISTASASLMTEILTGKTLAQAEALFAAFHARVTTGEVIDLAAELEDASDRLEPSPACEPIRLGSNARPWRGTPSMPPLRAVSWVRQSRQSNHDVGHPIRSAHGPNAHCPPSPRTEE